MWTLTLFGPLANLGAALLAWMMGYQRQAEVLSGPRDLEIRERVTVLGREVKTRLYRFEIESLAEVVLTSPASDLKWLAGVAPLALGSFLGMASLARGLLSKGLALEFGAVGLVILIASLAFDAGRDRLVRVQSPRGKLLVVPRQNDALLLVGAERDLTQLVAGLDARTAARAARGAQSEGEVPGAGAGTGSGAAGAGGASGGDAGAASL